MGLEGMVGDGFIATTADQLVGLGRQFSLWCIPYATSCCGLEYMAAMASRYDISRFGAERLTFAPRQADLLLCIGTIVYKMAPVIREVYDQMAEPKWVIAFGACTCSGGIFDTYSVVQGVDEFLPVDFYLPGCPPSPDAFLYAFTKMQEKCRKDKLSWERKLESGLVVRDPLGRRT